MFAVLCTLVFILRGKCTPHVVPFCPVQSVHMLYCYLINAEASLVENESRDRHYKRIFLLRANGCNMNVNKQCIFSRNIGRVPMLSAFGKRLKRFTRKRVSCGTFYV